jgi:hypothetical protein
MKISALIKGLEEIKEKFGDLNVRFYKKTLVTTYGVEFNIRYGKTPELTPVELELEV